MIDDNHLIDYDSQLLLWDAHIFSGLSKILGKDYLILRGNCILLYKLRAYNTESVRAMRESIKIPRYSQKKNSFYLSAGWESLEIILLDMRLISIFG